MYLPYSHVIVYIVGVFCGLFSGYFLGAYDKEEKKYGPRY